MSPDASTAALVAWLRAQLDEQEQAANDAIAEADAHWPPTEFTAEWQWAYLTRHNTGGIAGLHCAPGAPTPADVLADVAAKRRILVALPADLDGFEARVRFGDWESCAEPCAVDTLVHVIRLLGAAYADHPDYRQEWRP